MTATATNIDSAGGKDCHADVIIVGAGLSGISAAVHLRENCSNKSYLILEARSALGGTWDLFRYPGIRSDSDMHTLGFSFKPWTNPKAIADGPSIKQYIEETAAEYGLMSHIRLQKKLLSANWCSAEARWQLRVENAAGEEERFSCNFLYVGAGYFRYDKGYTPEFPGREQFDGQVVHPQLWPEDLNYKNKKVVIVGSGATAVTLVPELAKEAARVTMLQRSPTYMISRPGHDAVGNFLSRILPQSWAYMLTRWKNISLLRFAMWRLRRNPEGAKQLLLKWVQQDLPEGFDMKHFTPHYAPWDQRLCLVPDADFFDSLKQGKADIITDEIERFTNTGIQLKSGTELPADIIVTATGLDVRAVGGVKFSIDHQALQIPDAFVYKGSMFSGIPNMVSVFGYVAASWTLKADLVAKYVCRLLNYMDEHQVDVATPIMKNPELEEKLPMLSLTSGYVKRALLALPKQADHQPWQMNQDYMVDRKILLRDPIDDGVIEFSKLAVEAEKGGAPIEPGSIVTT